MKRVLKTVGALLLAGTAACASTNAMPERLQSAQRAYTHASDAPGAELVMVDLYRASKSLKQAEDAWNAEHDNPFVDDLAYIAEREAQLAEARGEAAVAEKKRKAAEHAVTQIYAEATGRLERTVEQSAARANEKEVAAEEKPAPKSQED